MRIQAAFTGNADDYGSVSAVYIQGVNKAGTATALAATRAQIRGIGREELVAAVDAIGLVGVNPVGAVIFRRNGRVIGRVGLVGGTASLVLPKRNRGRGQFVANFQGNARFGGSMSALLVLPA